MKIAMANDHAGYELKMEIKEILEKAGHEVVDFGCHDENAVDLSDCIYPAALAVGKGEVERGVFVDGAGFASAMVSNKIHGVYAAVCQDPFCASLSREHSNSNVLCIGGKIIGSALAHEIVKTWMATDYAGEVEKYKRRTDKVVEIANKHLKPLD